MEAPMITQRSPLWGPLLFVRFGARSDGPHDERSDPNRAQQEPKARPYFVRFINRDVSRKVGWLCEAVWIERRWGRSGSRRESSCDRQPPLPGYPLATEVG